MKKRDRKVYMREYRKKNPEKIKLWEKNRKRNTPEGMKIFLEWQRKRRIEYKKRLLEFKKYRNGCDKCGWKEHPEILQFHHLDKKTKRIKLAGGNTSSYSWDTILKEIKKCELLCPNCHMWLHYAESGLKGIPL